MSNNIKIIRTSIEFLNFLVNRNRKESNFKILLYYIMFIDIKREKQKYNNM